MLAIMMGSNPGNSGVIPLARVGLADLLAERIHQDTDGSGQASDRAQQFAHLPDCFPVLAQLNIGDLVSPEISESSPSSEVKAMLGSGSYNANRLSPAPTAS